MAIASMRCNDCAFATKCVAKAKLKPFTEEAKVDFGVELTFVSCKDYKPAARKTEKDNDK